MPQAESASATVTFQPFGVPGTTTTPVIAVRMRSSVAGLHLVLVQVAGADLQRTDAEASTVYVALKANSSRGQDGTSSKTAATTFTVTAQFA